MGVSREYRGDRVQVLLGSTVTTGCKFFFVSDSVCNWKPKFVLLQTIPRDLVVVPSQRANNLNVNLIEVPDHRSFLPSTVATPPTSPCENMIPNIHVTPTTEKCSYLRCWFAASHQDEDIGRFIIESRFLDSLIRRDFTNYKIANGFGESIAGSNWGNIKRLGSTFSAIKPQQIVLAHTQSMWNVPGKDRCLQK